MKGLVNQAGGLRNFFGDGSDGAFDPSAILAAATAPNGGTVANLWDRNAGTVFTTGSLTAASDCVLFQIDFITPTYLRPAPNSAITLFSVSISTGAARTGRLQGSNDGVTWDNLSSGVVSTIPGQFDFTGSNTPYRYFRLILVAGGADCKFSTQGGVINLLSGDTQTNKIWNIVYPSALNGPAVVKQFSSLTLPAGYSMTVENPCQGLIVYCQGNAVINGTIDMSKKAGLAPNGNIIPMPITKKNGSGVNTLEKYLQLTNVLQALCGGTGGTGGTGGGISGSRRASGGSGGAGRVNAGGFGGGGAGGASYSSPAIGQAGGSISPSEIGGGKTIGGVKVSVMSYSTSGYFFISPAQPQAVNGAGGAGGIDLYGGLYGAETFRETLVITGSSGKALGGGSGGLHGIGLERDKNVTQTDTADSEYAGGLVLLIVGGSVSGSGAITANGGSGSAGGSASSSSTWNRPCSGGGGGGGAGGGVIAIFHVGSNTHSGTKSVNGGTGGAGGTVTVWNGSENGYAGSSGSVGTIHIQQVA